MGYIKEPKGVDFTVIPQTKPDPEMDRMVSEFINIELFKQFKIESGNLVWGKNWDLIFPVNQLYRGTIN